jgi:hypothetical protein
MSSFWHGAGESNSSIEHVLDRPTQISVIPEIETHDMRPAGTPRRVFCCAGQIGQSKTETPMSIPPRGPGGKPVTRALVAALQESSRGADVPNLRRIVDSLIGQAIDGDLSAIREIFDRIDGKVPTAAAGAGAEEPRRVVFRWKGDDE